MRPTRPNVQCCKNYMSQLAEHDFQAGHCTCSVGCATRLVWLKKRCGIGCRAAMLSRIRCNGQGPKTGRGGQSGPSHSALAASILHCTPPHHPSQALAFKCAGSNAEHRPAVPFSIPARCVCGDAVHGCNDIATEKTGNAAQDQVHG